VGPPHLPSRRGRCSVSGTRILLLLTVREELYPCAVRLTLADNRPFTWFFLLCVFLFSPAQILAGEQSTANPAKLRPITFAAFKCFVLHGRIISKRTLPVAYIARAIEQAPKWMAASSNGAALRLAHCHITGDVMRVAQPSLLSQAYGSKISEHLQHRGAREAVYLRLPIRVADTIIDPKLYLDSVVIRRPLRFENVRFLNSVYFQGAVLQSRVDFENVSFEDLADFSAIWLSADLSCNDCKFAGVANFAHSYVVPGARIYIGGRALNSPVDFSESIFRGTLTLEGDPRTLQIYDELYLNGVNASLAEPAGVLRMKNVEVRGSFYADQGKWRTVDCAELQDGKHRPIRFSGFSDFRQSTFREVDFGGVEFTGLADFSDATILRQVSLERIKLQRPIHLEWHQIEKGLKRWQESAAKSRTLSKQTYEELQRNFKEIGDLESENACFYEMSVNHEKGLKWFFGYLFGYGVKRRNPFALAMFSLLLFWAINSSLLKHHWFTAGVAHGLIARVPPALVLTLSTGRLKLEFPGNFVHTDGGQVVFAVEYVWMKIAEISFLVAVANSSPLLKQFMPYFGL